LYKYREYKMDQVRTTLLTGLYKDADKSLAISHCCHGDLVGRTTFRIFFFLSGLQKLEQWAKKCIEFCGDYVE